MSSDRSSFALPGRTGLARRSLESGNCNHRDLPPDTPPAGGEIHPIIDPPPKTKPVFQLIAFGAILLFGCLQFLPVTHLRDPYDPLRRWIPVDASIRRGSSNVGSGNGGESGRVHVVSSISCLDLRALAVLINSTLISSRSPENVYFHFFMPDNEDGKMSYYKLKVLFPNTNLNIIGKNETKAFLLTSIREGGKIWSQLPELAPFIILCSKLSLRRFIYVSPDTIIKGSLEELVSTNMGHYAIAAAENCNKNLGDYINIDILNAIQKTTTKSWVSREPYNMNACVPDLNVLLIDGNKLQKHFFEAIRWWNEVLYSESSTSRRNTVYTSAILALHKRYLKLSNNWKLSDANANVVRFDGPRRVCSEKNEWHQGHTAGNIWQRYLSLKSDFILGN